MLRLMEARNEDARFQGCAECLVWLPCFVVVQASLPCLAVVSRYLFLDIFSGCNVSLPLALFASRSAVYCPFRVCCPLLVVVLLVRFICCLQLSNRIASTPRALLLVCLSCLIVDGILHMWSQVSNQGAHSTRGLMSISFVDILS